MFQRTHKAALNLLQTRFTCDVQDKALLAMTPESRRPPMQEVYNDGNTNRNIGLCDVELYGKTFHVYYWL